jgi:hypothetical protein
LVRTAIDAIVKLQNQDNIIFAFSSPIVKRYMKAGRRRWKSLFRACPPVKCCVLGWSERN